MDYKALRTQLINELNEEAHSQTSDDLKLSAIGRLLTVVSEAEDIDRCITNENYTAANALKEFFNCIEHNHNHIISMLSEDIVVANTLNTITINLSDFNTILASAQTYVQLAKSEGNANAANIVLN